MSPATDNHPPNRRQDTFLSDVLAMADPHPVADLLARYDALLVRVTVLERALEKIQVLSEESTVRKRDADLKLERIRKIAERAING